jgi:endonuclease/exonuclease/phosphatase family metal-dependent hydrolase
MAEVWRAGRRRQRMACEGGAVRVATFNVQHARRPDGAVDVDALANACAGLAADVLALQEVDRSVPRSGRRDLAAEVARRCGAAFAFASARPLDGGAYGNAVLVRGRIGEVRALRLPRRGRREPRGALLARVVVAGTALGVAATHLGTDQTESARQLAAVLRALRDLPRPWLLLGDLNRHPDQVLDAVTGAGLDLVGGPPTYPAGAPVARIDHVALAGLRAERVDVVPAPVSDHRPLVVEVAPAGAGATVDLR